MNSETPLPKEIRLKLSLGLLLTLVFLYRLATTTADPDLWGYLAFGRLLWEQGRFPYQDVFSWVPTINPWIYHEWLTGVLFYPLYQHLGGPGLQVLKYGFGLATAGLIYLTARKRGADPLAAALMLFIVQGFLTVGYSAVRAQVFTYFFFALTLYLLETARLTGHWRGLWFLVLIQVPWCNLHGGFLSGLGLIALYALGEALSRRPFWPFAGIFVLSGLATLINPYGLKYWAYLGRAVSMPRPEITEWASSLQAYLTGITSANEFLYFVAIIIFAFFLIWWGRWREITPGLILIFTLYLGLSHNRHQVFFMLTVGAYLPLLLTAYLEVWKSRLPFPALSKRLRSKIPLLAGALIAVFLGYQIVSLSPLSLKTPPGPQSGTMTELYYPVGAVAYLKEQGLSGKLLTDFNWGEYLIWTLYPQCRVAIDGRYETVYPEEVARLYFDFLFGRPAWRQFLEHYPPEMILIDTRTKVYHLMLREAPWRQVYADSGCALFLRQQ